MRGGERKRNVEIQEIEREGITFKGEAQCAQVINEYFINVASGNRFDKEAAIKNIKRNENSIFLRPVTDEEMEGTINKMKENKAPGDDKIQMKWIKQNKEALTPILTEIMNKSFDKGEYPDSLKTSVITALFKKGERKKVENYRPIAIMNSFAKIFESIIHDRIYDFLERKSKVITSKQYAYRKNKSIQNFLLEFQEGILTALDEKKITAACFIDVTKAFDSVDREILLEKLDRYGIRGKANDLMKSYFENRYQRVKIGKTISSNEITKKGLPQGSSLAPLLYIIYTNDLESDLKETETLKYADDTVIY